MDGFDCLGADEGGGFDYGALLQTAGGLLQGGIAAYESSEAEAKLTGEARKKLADVIAADIEASNAVARATVSAQLRSKSASSDASAAARAVAAQDRAGADLSPEAAQVRATAADKMLATATKNAQAKPKDGYLAVLVKAWTATANKAHSTAISNVDTGGKAQGDKESWLTRPVVGKLPGYSVVVGGIALLGVLGLTIKKIFFR